jgi:tetratricopeptide (TPR) repeat protein
VSEFASAGKIKEAYAAAKYKAKLELDTDRPDKEVEERIRALEEAFLTLGDEQKRAEFDQLLGDDPQQVAGPEGPSRYAGNTSSAEAIYRDGLRHMRLGGYSTAAVCFRKVLQQDKANPYLLKRLARAYWNAGEIKFAAQTIEQAIELDHSDWENYFILGKVLEQQDNLIGARRCFKRAFELNPADQRANAEFQRGSLVWEKIGRSARAAAKSFLPDPRAKSPRAKSLRLADGLVARATVTRTVGAALQRLKPQPSRHTFRYMGVI